jgi:hypothetical protein
MFQSMKKRILPSIILSLLFFCLFTTDSAAFVVSKKGETLQTTPPQYKISQGFSLHKISKTTQLRPQIEEETDLETTSNAAQLLGFMAFLSAFTLLAGVVFPLILITVLTIATITKANQVLSNKRATGKQKVRARLGLRFGLVVPMLALILIILIYLDRSRH